MLMKVVFMTGCVASNVFGDPLNLSPSDWEKIDASL